MSIEMIQFSIVDKTDFSVLICFVSSWYWKRNNHYRWKFLSPWIKCV